jgi:hypothetical protein
MDNNFLATTEAHQEAAVRRLADADFRSLDFNQGLDAHRYTPAFRRILERCGVRVRTWRFSYDAPGDWPAVERALRDLRAAGVGFWDVRVYLLYNWDDTPQEIVERAERVIGSRDDPLACPWPMAYRPPDWLGPEDYVAPGWTLQAVRDIRRYYGRPNLWRAVAWPEYDRAYPRGVVAGGYPPDWEAIARRVKESAGWCCEDCTHPHEPGDGYTLTVHHLDGDRGHNDDENLVALCQRCHLRWRDWQPGQAVMAFARPEWMVRRGLGGAAV